MSIVKFTTSAKDRLPDLMKALEDLAKKRVLVGIPADKSFRDGEINNAQLAFIHDKGSPAQNIPARSFMEPGIESGLPAITAQLKKTAQAAFDGDFLRGVDTYLHRDRLGSRIAADCGRTAVLFVPATLAARRRKGFY